MTEPIPGTVVIAPHLIMTPPPLETDVPMPVDGTDAEWSKTLQFRAAPDPYGPEAEYDPANAWVFE